MHYISKTSQRSLVKKLLSTHIQTKICQLQAAALEILIWSLIKIRSAINEKRCMVSGYMEKGTLNSTCQN